MNTRAHARLLSHSPLHKIIHFIVSRTVCALLVSLFSLPPVFAFSPHSAAVSPDTRQALLFSSMSPGGKWENRASAEQQQPRSPLFHMNHCFAGKWRARAVFWGLDTWLDLNETQVCLFYLRCWARKADKLPGWAIFWKNPHFYSWKWYFLLIETINV